MIQPHEEDPIGRIETGVHMSHNGTLNISRQDVGEDRRVGIHKNDDRTSIQSDNMSNVSDISLTPTLILTNNQNGGSDNVNLTIGQNGATDSALSQNNDVVNENIMSKLLFRGTDDYSTETTSVDINNFGVDLQNVEEWLKTRSDSLSSLDFDSEIKPAENDIYDFLNIKSGLQFHSIGGVQEQAVLGNKDSSIELGNTSIQHVQGLGEVPELNNSIPLKRINANKKLETLTQFDRGLFEELLLTPDLQKRNKVKMENSLMLSADERGLFEEELLPNVQELLAGVMNEKIKDVPITTINTTQDVNNCSVSLPIIDEDMNCVRETSDELDLILRNNPSLKLMTPQEIENMPSRSLGFDETPVKLDNCRKKQNEFAFSTFGNCQREVDDSHSSVEMLGSLNSEIDSKLSSLLAMDASNDTPDTHIREINLMDVVSKSLKKSDQTPGTFLVKLENDEQPQTKVTSKVSTAASAISSHDILTATTGSSMSYFSDIKALTNTNEITTLNPVLNAKKESQSDNSSSSNVINLIPNKSFQTIKIPSTNSGTSNVQKNSTLTVALPLNPVIQLNNSQNHQNFLKLKVNPVTSNSGLSTNITNSNKKIIKVENSNVQGKLKVPTGMVQLRLAPYQVPVKAQTSPQTVLLKPVNTTIMPQNNIIQNTKAFTTIDASKNTKIVPIRQINPQEVSTTLSPGTAKINIKVDRKANFTKVSIVSSNNEHTVFKINTCDLIRAVSSIREPHLDLLGLSPQQLLQSATTAQQLINHLLDQSASKKKEGNKDTTGPQNFEINQVVPELKAPISRSINSSVSIPTSIPSSQSLPETVILSNSKSTESNKTELSVSTSSTQALSTKVTQIPLRVSQIKLNGDKKTKNGMNYIFIYI